MGFVRHVRKEQREDTFEGEGAKHERAYRHNSPVSYRGEFVTEYEVELDSRPGASQQEEELVVTHPGGEVERMLLHEYDRVYAIPGLYEEVVQHRLQCASPARLAKELCDAVRAAGGDPASLVILDLGAGNGLVAEELLARGVTRSGFGLDPSPAAEAAVERDRPGTYREFFTAETDDIDVSALVRDYGVNALVGAGALGLGHISADSFQRAWSALAPDSWFAVTAPETDATDPDSDLGRYLDELGRGDDTEIVTFERYRHRLSMSGEPIHYYVIVARRA